MNPDLRPSGAPRRRRTRRPSDLLEDSVIAALMYRHGIRIALTPQLDLMDWQLIGASVSHELLHPHQGVLQARDAAPAIERLGLELLLFYRVLARTVALQQRLCANGVHLPLSVSVPAAVIAAPEVRTHLMHRMRATGLAPSLLRLNVHAPRAELPERAPPGVCAWSAGVDGPAMMPPAIAATLRQVNAMPRTLQRC